MARTADGPDAYLQLHDGVYRVSMGVPKPLREQLGSHLSRSLGTRTRSVARALKVPVVAEFKKKIEQAWIARGGRKLSVFAEAVQLRKLRDEAGERGDPAWDHINKLILERQVEILRENVIGKQTLIIEDAGPEDVPLYSKEGRDTANAFRRIAEGNATPIALHHQAFIDTLGVSPRSALDEPRALNIFLDWLQVQHPPIDPYIENIDFDVAVRFMDEMPTFTDLSWATNAKYFGRLKLYWSWLKKRRHVKENPFSELTIQKKHDDDDVEERAYTDGEVQRLFMGEPLEGDGLRDVMLIAALSGARLDAVIDLRVGDCAEGWFTFKKQKKEKSDRDVPIHPDLVGLVARRIKGKLPNDDLFPEWPAVKSKTSTRPRSAYFSKRFTKYSRDVGVREEVEGKRRSLINFHSFRRWFITKLERAGVDGDLSAAIVGHKRSGLTLGRYSAGPLMRAAIEAIAKVHLPPLDGTPVIEDKALTPRRRSQP